MLQQTLDDLGEWLEKTEDLSTNNLNTTRLSPSRPIPSLERPIAFSRLDSEKRDRLEPQELDLVAERSVSADRRFRSRRRTGLRATSSVPTSTADHDLPELESLSLTNTNLDTTGRDTRAINTTDTALTGALFGFAGQEDSKLQQDLDTVFETLEDWQIRDELETKWILNLSMRFRDRSDREKFFITWIETPRHWWRLTVTLDYREASDDSLESDIRSLPSKREKSCRIYEFLRESLPTLELCPTVTNLKLQTLNGRLNIHVTEDMNELIDYPELSLFPYIDLPCYQESELEFDSHLSGFVYSVAINGRIFIKKEIPAPDTVEEFLYEINALWSLRHSSHVIPIEGFVVDESREFIRGLLISYATNGALVDLLFHLKDTNQLPWSRRERWARQIVQGLSDIHEAGFVQGDFTLSNIVIDHQDNARIIDINRRGCPMGWEPPDMKKMIEARQKISLFIGVKTDIYQLGMVLWALVEVNDEPDRVDRPLEMGEEWNRLPDYYREIFKLCYADEPQDRASAKEILALFPKDSLQAGFLSSVTVPALQLNATDMESRNSAQPSTTMTTIDLTSHYPLHVDSGFHETQPVEMDRESLPDSLEGDFSGASYTVGT